MKNNKPGWFDRIKSVFAEFIDRISNKRKRPVLANASGDDETAVPDSKTVVILKKTGRVSWKIVSIILNIVLTVLLIGMITGVIVGSVFALYIKNYVDPTVDTSLLITQATDTTTRIYYMDYETPEDRQNGIGTSVELEDQRLYSSSNSIWASYEQFPEYLKDAFISIEDHRFESHKGVDWIRTASATLGFFFGEGDFGGSTITQQLIKNLTGEEEATIQRKVQEIFRALNLEKDMSKDQILEMYLNIIFLSNNCTGVQAASERYFDKNVSDLSLAECATLAAIVKNPYKYDPISHPEENKARRDDVLFRMNELGKITEEEYQDALNTELVIASRDENSNSNVNHVNSWYTDAVIDDVQQALMEEYGYSSYVSSMLIFSGGLQIITPMDPEVQSVLEEVYENDAEYFPHPSNGLQPESAMVVCDPYTNDVLGLVGGRGEKTQNRILNRATQSQRPPGSSIKPISIYAPAMDEGIITYGSVYDDSPLMFNGNTPYPQNLPRGYNGLTTIHSAITTSKNTIAMRVLEDLTIDASYDFLTKKLHIGGTIDSLKLSSGKVVTDKALAPLALGQLSYGLTVKDITAAYSIFVNNGIYAKSRLWLKVLDSAGNVILDNAPEYEIVISEQTASIMTLMMENVVRYGTATAITLDNYVNVAAKTGTASNDFDRWFLGYTPYYVGGVWTGYDMNQSLDDFGTSPSLIVWDKVMTMLHQKYIDAANSGGDPIKSFELASGVITATYCRDSGKLVSSACSHDPRGSRAETGYFTASTVPTEYCDVHVLVDYDKSTGCVASPECNKANIVKYALISVPNRNFASQVYISDAQYVYRYLPPNVKPGTTTTMPFFQNTISSGFVGITGSGKQFNCYCTAHCNYDRWVNPGKYTTPVTEPPATDPPAETNSSPSTE